MNPKNKGTSLDLTRLERLRQLPGGKIIARCPACAEDGGDRKGDHLAVFVDGHFACAANAGDDAHRRRISALVGIKTGWPSRGPSQVRRRNGVRKQSRCKDQGRQWQAESVKAKCEKLVERWQWEYYDVWESSPTRPTPAIDDPRIFIAALFPPDSILWTGAVHQSGRGHQDRWRTVADWFESPLYELGPMTCPATWLPESSNRSAANVETGPFVVLDFDGPKGWKPDNAKELHRHITDSLSIVRWLHEGQHWKLAAIVHTGSKSLHAWFYHPGGAVVESLREFAPTLGIDVGLIGHPEHPCRLPGQSHEKTGRLSRVLWLV